MLKRTSTFVVGVLFAFLTVTQSSTAHAAVPAPSISLTASASKISGTSWTNDGSLGGTATLSTANTPAPTFQSSDTSVALNASAGTNQYVTQSLGNGSALSVVTFQLTAKILSTQANTVSYGMIMGWTGSNYDIWNQGGCIGFNTGTSEIYGINNSSNYDSFHTYTFVMSNTQDNTTKQKIFVDGVQQTLSMCFGSSVTQTSKNFGNTPSSFTIAKYGSGGHYGTLNIRSFKLWASELTTAQIQESYNATLTPTSHTIALTSGLSTAVFRTISTVRSTTDVEGTVTFFQNGKRIAGCINLATSGKQVDCSWRPSVLNSQYLTAQLTAPGGNLTSSALKILVTKRTGNR